MDKVPLVRPLSRAKIEALAMNILREFQPEALRGKFPQPVDVEAIFEIYIPSKVDVQTGYTDLSRLIGSEILGYTNAAKRVSFVDCSLSDATDRGTLRRFRSTLGHEGGHCLLHVPLLQLFRSISRRGEGLYRVNRSEIKAFQDPEWQAWEFARAIMMPKLLIMDYLERGFDLNGMADQFEANPAFLRVRLQTLKIKAF